MIVLQQKEILLKEKRRANRNKKWLANGNVIPLSTKERKSIENNEYRIRIKAKDSAKKNNESFNNEYRNQIYEFANQFEYTHKGSLTYRLNVSMFKAYRDAIRIFELLKKRGFIENYLLVVEFEDKHVHTHFIIYCKKTKVKSTIHNQFNGGYDNGYVYLEELQNELDKDNHLTYLINKLQPEKRNRQSQIDYWSIDLDVKQDFINALLPQHDEIVLIEELVP